jgi:hypothetical protein
LNGNLKKNYKPKYKLSIDFYLKKIFSVFQEIMMPQKSDLQSSFLWDLTQPILIVTNVSGQLFSPTLEPINCPKASVANCQFTLLNISEERRSHLHSSGSLKSRKADRIIKCVDDDDDDDDDNNNNNNNNKCDKNIEHRVR